MEDESVLNRYWSYWKYLFYSVNERARLELQAQKAFELWHGYDDGRGRRETNCYRHWYEVY